jgi:hypothetical protein
MSAKKIEFTAQMTDAELVARWLKENQPTLLPDGNAKGASSLDRWAVKRAKGNAHSRAKPYNTIRWSKSAKAAWKQRRKKSRKGATN